VVNAWTTILSKRIGCRAKCCFKYSLSLVSPFTKYTQNDASESGVSTPASLELKSSRSVDVDLKIFVGPQLESRELIRRQYQVGTVLGMERVHHVAPGFPCWFGLVTVGPNGLLDLIAYTHIEHSKCQERELSKLSYVRPVSGYGGVISPL